MTRSSRRAAIRLAMRPPCLLRQALMVALIGCLFITLPSSRAEESVAPRPTDHDAESKPLDFTRVHVPAGRLSEIPLGTARYVPMSAREFEEGIARLSAGGQAGRREATEPALQPLADAARYLLSQSEDGSLSGSVSFDVGGFAGASAGSRLPRLAVAREMPLGNLEVRSGSMRTGAGMGEAVVFGRRDGTFAVATPQAGTYTCDFRCGASPGADDAASFSLPLVPSLSSSIRLRLPRGVQPMIVGDLRAYRVGEEPQQQAAGGSAPSEAMVAWQIDTGPRGSLELSLVKEAASSPMLSLWTAVGIHGRQGVLHVLVRPMDAWLPGKIRIEKDAAVLVTQVAAGGEDDLLDDASWSVAEERKAILIDVPRRCVGDRVPLLIHAVAPIGDRFAPVPLLRAPAEVWAGGGIAIQTAPSLTLSSIELQRCLVVPPEVAARWPLPLAAGSAAADVTTAHAAQAQDGSGPDDAAPGVWPSRLFVEEQSPGAVVTLSLLARTADLDVMRVTTVDLSPGVVVGRATCDVRVRRGEAFDLTARITPGWFIDSVEAISLSTPAELAETPRRRSGDDPATALDWKVIRDTRGDVLRIGLIAAVTPARGLGLRITGHRAGIALGEEFSTAEIDMVRLDGESERSALVDLRTSPETTVEFPHDQASSTDRPLSAGPAPSDVQTLGPDGRLAMLMEEGAARARLWAGFRAASRPAQLVRRRPPLDARTQVRLTVRDDRLTEAVTFECHPAGADLDSIVVQFSEPVDDPLEWSLLPPAVGTVAARRLDSSDRRSGAGNQAAAGGERWLVELNPPARGPVTIRAARSVPFTRPTPVLLAWVDGATSAVGHCIVRNVGRIPPTVVNRRLGEVPPESLMIEDGQVTVAEFSFDPAAASDPTDVAAAELTPGDADGRAWAWREITSSWCHASGATEYETLFEIDNHGRTSLALSIPPGRRVQGILLDGVRLPLGERAAAGGQVPIELPAGRSLVTVLVRTVTDGENSSDRFGSGLWSAWRVDAAGVKLDIPVLQREWRLLLPPELEIALVSGSARVVGAVGRRDWVARLFAVRGRGRWWPSPSAVDQLDESSPAFHDNEGVSSALAATGGLQKGFRQRVLVPAGAGSGEADVVVVHTRVLSAAAVLAGLAAGFATLLAARGSLRRAVLLCLLAGVAALWIVVPFDGVARAAWWASLAALTLAVTGCLPGRRRGRVNDAAAGGEGLAASLLLVSSLVCSLAVTPVVAAEDEAGPAAETASARHESAAPMQVFITPIAGDQKTGRGSEATVLVPEELFRALVRGEDGRAAAAAVRVMAVRATAATSPEDDGSWTSWRLDVDVDADAGGILLLDQSGSGARFRPGTLRIDRAAVTARLDAAGDRLRFVVPDAGRHTVSVDVEAAVRRRGDVETATISLPQAPEASLQLTPSAGRNAAAAAVVCERATASDVFVAAARRSADSTRVVFDVSRSTQVRLSRSVDAGVSLATLPPSAVSRNDIFWNLDECRLTGVYDIDAGDAIVRSCVVSASAGLEWIAPSVQQDGRPQDDGDTVDGVSIRPLGGRRFLVERRSPERGRFRFEIPFRMVLADAVGVFDVPEAWVEDVLVDTRSARFVASPSLAVRIDLPPGLAHTDTPEGEASFDTRFWRGEILRSIAVDAEAGSAMATPAAPPSALRARLTAERRRQEIRGSQREAVVFADEQVRMHLDARLDASSTALVTIPLDVPAGAVIDRIELYEDDVLHPETAERGAIDLRWSRAADTSVSVVVQRPRAGRFRLEVDARIPGRPAARGPMPCLRVGLTDGSRTLIDWRAEDGLEATLQSASEDGTTGDAPRTGQFELVAGEPPPMYVLEPSPAASAATSVDTPTTDTLAEPVADGVGRVELADIRLALDERGRVWGLACFEMVPAEQVVRLELPRSWRLFDAVVDGRSVECVVPTSSASDNVWELRLHDVGRPRTIVALFAGEMGRRLLDGEPLALTPPNIVGLSCRQVIWTVQVPTGISLRVAAPARVVTAEALRGERRQAQQRVEDDFQRAFERSVGWQQDRVRMFQDSRRDGASPSADQAWARTLTTPGDPLPAPFCMVAADGVDGAVAGRLTIRAVRQRDPTTRGRALATLSLLACGGLAWMAARRHWAVRLPSVPGLGAALSLLGGLAWTALLDPAWPGLLLAAAGVAAAIRAWLMSGSSVVEEPRATNIAEATTIYRPQR